MKRCFEDLCATMDKLGVPRESKWRGLILYMRSIRDYEFLTAEQRERTQDLVMQVLRRKDFSDKAFQKLLRDNEAIINDRWRHKLTETLQDTAQLIKQFQTLLQRRKNDVQDLEVMTLETIHSDQPMEKMVAEIQNGFQKIEGMLQSDLETIVAMSMTDELTKIYNRRALDSFMHRAITNSLSCQTPLAMVFLDIDNFKQFNDKYGHLVGDQALITVAGLLKACINDQERGVGCTIFPARFGGEEFVLIMPGASDSEAVSFAEKVRKRIQDYNFLIRNGSGEVVYSGVKITISAGVAELHAYCGHSPNSATLIEAADRALYQAKKDGRNKVVLYQGNGVPET
ncbi:diguanylate cyclase (GGDEF) domain-containing protein [Desulfonatronum thiosulfatophilum]|uniref:diguanylate cyclase n=1 Tax=Desulfonatronum thiosulfatophilum TaxID=617002 RepID=A0A1G6AV60_9BACT|nr:GGDEF domain-containing protein [Desulfonatronum thiosulfatophilum]SDB12153.1 diguanylate cyclase (GGDEF) domain-containing protein [Desulfonatronum thiosulfatophilum]